MSGKGLALFAGLAIGGLVLALGKKKGDAAVVGGPPKPIVWVETPGAADPGVKREVVDLFVLEPAPSGDGVESAALLSASSPRLAHYLVDPEVIVQTAEEDRVLERDEASPLSIYVAILEPGNLSTIESVAWLLARASRRWGFPLSKLDPGTIQGVERPRGVLAAPGVDLDPILALARKR